MLTMDISKHLHEYEVEYHVLQEEMSTPRPEIEQLKRLELENRRLTDQNLALIDQLEVTTFFFFFFFFFVFNNFKKKIFGIFIFL